MIPHGFEQDGPGCYRKMWRDDKGTPHIITVARVIGGWMYKWECGPTMTVRESHGHADIHDVMTRLWEDVFQMQQHYQELLRLQAARIVRGEKD